MSCAAVLFWEVVWTSGRGSMKGNIYHVCCKFPVAAPGSVLVWVLIFGRWVEISARMRGDAATHHLGCIVVKRPACLPSSSLKQLFGHPRFSCIEPIAASPSLRSPSWKSWDNSRPNNGAVSDLQSATQTIPGIEKSRQEFAPRRG